MKNNVIQWLLENGNPMNKEELNGWFSELKEKLENAYLSSDEPWKQSGFSGPEERWTKCRKPVAECINESGMFLDIGCANGYLLECVKKWTEEKGLSIVPFGVDISSKLVELARYRLPEFKNNIFVGNGLTWESPQKFDYVRTELCYVPEPFYKKYVDRLVKEFLNKNGKLLIVEYRSRRDDEAKEWIDISLKKMGFEIEDYKSAFYEGKELTRVVVVRKM